jgi:hypothetical protein
MLVRWQPLAHKMQLSCASCFLLLSVLVITVYITADTQQVSAWAQAGGGWQGGPSVAQHLALPWIFALCTLHPAPFILAMLHETSLKMSLLYAG